MEKPGGESTSMDIEKISKYARNQSKFDLTREKFEELTFEVQDKL